MKASVIITTYKRPDFLLRAVKSVLAQSVPTEVVVVDDNGLGTEDQLNTQIVLQPFLDKITYLPLEKNGGACIARNEGVKIASGEYIFFLDDDDEFLPNKVEVQTKFLDTNPQFDGCLSAFKRLGDDGKEISSESNYPKVGGFTDFVIRGNFFTPMLAIRKSSYIKTGGFRTIPRFQDRFFLLHCLQQGLTFAEIREPLYIMYEHAGERVTHNNVEKSIDSLNLLKSFIDLHHEKFTPQEYQHFLQKDYRMRATIYYVSKHYKLKAAHYWLKTWFLSRKGGDLLMFLKSFIR